LCGAVHASLGVSSVRYHHSACASLTLIPTHSQSSGLCAAISVG
jgi:hypothetical protein